jgi:hypothetical protein
VVVTLPADAELYVDGALVNRGGSSATPARAEQLVKWS